MKYSGANLPAHSGLKPFSEFEELMKPLFARISPEERDQTLRKIYSVMGEKKVLEATQKQLQDERDILEVKQESIVAMRGHISKAMEELRAAADSLHNDLPAWFDFHPVVNVLAELDTFLSQQEQSMNGMVQRLSNPEGLLVATELDGNEITTTVSLTSPAIKTPFDLTSPDRYEFELPDERTVTIDDPFIESVIECLPPKPPGAQRSRFGRDKILEKVFEFMDQRWSPTRFVKALGRINKRKKN